MVLMLALIPPPLQLLPVVVQALQAHNAIMQTDPERQAEQLVKDMTDKAHTHTLTSHTLTHTHTYKYIQTKYCTNTKEKSSKLHQNTLETHKTHHAV